MTGVHSAGSQPNDNNLTHISGSFGNREEHGLRQEQPLRWALPDRLTESPTEFIRKLDISEFIETIYADLTTKLDQVGIPMKRSERLGIKLALGEALKNSVVHGLLRIERSENYFELATASGDELARRIKALNPISGKPEIVVTTEVTDEKMIVQIHDGGSMTPALFQERWGNWKQFDQHDKVLDAIQAKVQRGEELSTEDLETSATLIECPSGRGFAYLMAAFTDGIGMPGGIVLTRNFSRAMEPV